MPGIGRALVGLLITGIVIGVTVALAAPVLWGWIKPVIRTMVA